MDSHTDDRLTVERAIETRRTVHKYKAEPIDEHVLRKALELACLAPNHHLTEPWRFTRVLPATRQQLTSLQMDLKSGGDPDSLGNLAKEGIREKIENPAELLVVSLVRSSDEVTAREDYAAVACALQNMAVYLWSHGLGTKWSSGKLTKHPRTYEYTNVDAEVEEIIGFFWIGVPKVIPKVPARSMSLGEILRTA